MYLCAYADKVIAVDVNPSVIKRAERFIRHSLRRRKIKFHAGTLQSLNLPANSIDHIFCVCVLQLVDNLPAELAEMHRVLKPGGWIHATVDSFSYNDDLSIKEVYAQRHGIKQYFTRDSIAQYFHKAGFNVIVNRYILQGNTAKLHFSRYFEKLQINYGFFERIRLAKQMAQEDQIQEDQITDPNFPWGRNLDTSEERKMKIKSVLQIIQRPAALFALMRDMLQIRNSVRDDETHLRAVMQWLCRAHDNGQGGVSIGWSLKTGWLPPYPETSGYIIPTFLRFAESHNEPEFIDRAIQIGKWLLKLQFDSGAFPSRPGTGGIPLVFDTAQIIYGLLSLFYFTQDERWLEPAIHAAEWIISIQQPNGSWVKGSHKGVPHTYYTRAVFPLFELAQVTGREEFSAAAERFLRWTLALRRPNGYIDKMAFSPDNDPSTHTVGYTYEGLLESLAYVSDDKLRMDILETLKAMAEHITSFIEKVPHGLLPAYVNSDWKFYGSFSCIVGNAQIAINLIRCSLLFNEPRYLRGAEILLEGVKSVQFLVPMFPDLHGGIAGAYPIWGGYGSLTIINWAAKFFADCLMLRKHIIAQT